MEEAVAAVEVEVVAGAGTELPDYWLQRLTLILKYQQDPSRGGPEKWHMQAVVLVSKVQLLWLDHPSQDLSSARVYQEVGAAVRLIGFLKWRQDMSDQPEGRLLVGAEEVHLVAEADTH